MAELRAGPCPPPRAERGLFSQWRSVCGVGKHGEAEASRDRDVRDIASQVMVSDGATLVL